ncbi:MAG: hypothetical protein RL357_978 [Pseudomonadota bacterium]|jgi:hypothetical protein
MDIYVLGMIAIALLVIILLIIYLTARVNDLEKETQSVASRLQETSHQSATAQGPFAGLSGQTLWEAMCGSPPQGLDDSRVEEVRQRYEPVLSKHIEALFEEGRVDAQMGATATPKNKRKISVLRGSVESWLPPDACNLIYQCGVDSVERAPEEMEVVRITLDDVCAGLYAKAGLELRQQPSQFMLPEAEDSQI